jgi:hypothetical protein
VCGSALPPGMPEGSVEDLRAARRLDQPGVVRPVRDDPRAGMALRTCVTAT